MAHTNQRIQQWNSLISLIRAGFLLMMLSLAGCTVQEEPSLVVIKHDCSDVQTVLGIRLWKFNYDSKGADKVTYRLEEYESGEKTCKLAEVSVSKPPETALSMYEDPYNHILLVAITPPLGEHESTAGKINIFLEAGPKGVVSSQRRLVDNSLRQLDQWRSFKINEISPATAIPLLGKLKRPEGKHEVSNCEWCLALTIEVEK